MRWAFFDLGDTLFNEDPLRLALYERLARVVQAIRPQTTFKALLALRRKRVLAGDPSPHYTIAHDLLPKSDYDAWAKDVRRFVAKEGQELVTLVPGAQGALDDLTTTHSLGIIADQPPSVTQTLERLGISRCFAVVALNSLTGFQKQDGALFWHALDCARCRADEAVMVGNRLDRDVAPARRVGMRAIFCYLSPMDKGWLPESRDAASYLDAITALPNWPVEPDPAVPEQTPDATVSRLDELPSAVRRLTG